MRDKAFVAVAACAILGLCISSGTAVFLALHKPAPIPEETTQERFERDLLSKRDREGPMGEMDKARLQLLAQRQLLRELQRADR